MEDFKSVEELEKEDYTVVTTDIEINDILFTYTYVEKPGKPWSESLRASDYPVLFVKEKDGEILEIYGHRQSVPYYGGHAERLYPK